MIEKLSDNQIKVLTVMGDWEDDEAYYYTRIVARKSHLSYRLTRICLRALVRKGLVDYGRGLMDDDGMLAGSGYQISQKGRAHLAASVGVSPARR
jgi:hypothetical protein